MTARKPEELALAEYQQVKSEQVALLLVPAVAFVLGWTYLANDTMITAIGRYVREHPVIGASMRWETDHPADKRRASRKRIQLAVDLATFCGSGAVALVTFWLAPSAQPVPLVLASAVEAVAVAVLAWQFTAYSAIPSARRALRTPEVK